MEKVFAIKWTTSRARDTYGYNVCTIVGEGFKSRCCGGGYDMLGTSLAGIMMQVYPQYFNGTISYTEEQKKRFYGLSVRADGTAYFNGACGGDCVVRFLEEMIKVRVKWIYDFDRRGHRRNRIGVEFHEEVCNED